MWGNLMKEPRLEIPGWTEMARGEPCQMQIEGVCLWLKQRDTETTVWAHSNSSRHGRGMHRKSDDCYGSLACGACHHWYDFGKDANRAVKEEAIVRGFERSIRHLIVVGKLIVWRKK